MKPTVSIIVPNYNHAPFLKERLDSIFNQTFQDFEVILLDDASTDNSLEILHQYKNHPKVTHFVVNPQNSGSPFLQWKKGLLLALGSYVWIAETDDSCDLNFLESNLSFRDKASVIVAQTKTFDSEGVKKEVQHPAFKTDHLVCLDTDSILYCPILNVSACIFKMIDLQLLDEAHFTNYSIIGDRVFYYEFFQHKNVVKNLATQSYFRQEGLGVSNLATKHIQYLKKYLIEHIAFIKYAHKNESFSESFKSAYVDRYFKRVRDRIPRSQKVSFTYIQILLAYMRAK